MISCYHADVLRDMADALERRALRAQALILVRTADELDRLHAQNGRLWRALSDAIKAPKGIVPDSAAEFFSKSFNVNIALRGKRGQAQPEKEPRNGG